MSQPRSIFGPLLLISTGVIWLLIELGKIPSANLWALTYIWPFLLIVAGIGLILRSYWKYATIVMDVVIIGGAVLAIVYAPQFGWDTPSMSTSFFQNDMYFGPSTRGSGDIVTETRELENFNAIEVDYPAQIFITQGEVESVTVEADDNFMSGLQTEVKNDTLSIYYKAEDDEHVNPSAPVKITIVVTELNKLDFESAGELNMDAVETDELKVSVMGAGNLKLNDMVAKYLTVSLSGAGGVTTSGVADNLDVIISGFGSFNGKDLHSKIASVNLSGAGSATVWVDDELDAHISGAGSINYYGSPEVTKQISGVGSVNQVADK